MSQCPPLLALGNLLAQALEFCMMRFAWIAGSDVRLFIVRVRQGDGEQEETCLPFQGPFGYFMQWPLCVWPECGQYV